MRSSARVHVQHSRSGRAKEFLKSLVRIRNMFGKLSWKGWEFGCVWLGRFGCGWLVGGWLAKDRSEKRKLETKLYMTVEALKIGSERKPRKSMH